jgi:hypothetical protein
VKTLSLPAARLLLGLLPSLLLLLGCNPGASSALPTRAAVAAIPTPAEAAPPTSTVAATLPATVTPPATATPIPTASVTAPPPASPTAPLSPTAPISATATAVSQGQTEVIGYSRQGRPLIGHQVGDGPVNLILVGAIHGGYEWNSALLVYRLLDHIRANPGLVPSAVTVHIIPVANPDGLALVTGSSGRFRVADVAADAAPGRFNGAGVDLNRNWDCQWEPTGLWRNQEVDAGAAPFSEPENVALRDFILARDPAAVVFYHSALDAVIAAGCPDLYGPAWDLAQLYGGAAGYPVYESFTAYPVHGDAADWLSTQGIAAITVELSTHEALDWAQNRAGVEALLREYGSVPVESGDEAE